MIRTALRALIVVPATNTTMEPEMTSLCPDLAPFAVARVVRDGGMFRAEELADYTQATLDALAPYRDDPPDLVFHGCTAAGFLAGVQGNARVVEAIRSHVDATVVSTAQSMADVLLAHGLTRISVLTPYVQSLNLGLRAFLAESGITVARLDSFDCRTLAAMLALTAEQVFAQAVDCVAPGSQGLFLACTQMPSLDIIPRLQDRLGIPVWSAISASAWAGERARAAMT